MPRENSIVSSIRKAAKKNGWWSLKIHGGFGRAGIPDLLCLKEGRAVFLEVKQPGKKASKLQIFTMGEIESEAGVPCFVVTSATEAIECLKLGGQNGTSQT